MIRNRDIVLNKQLDAFTGHVAQAIETSYQTGSIRPEFEVAQETHIEDFTYDENGPNYTRSSYPISHKENWMRAGFTLGEAIFKTSEYLALKDFVQKEYPNPNGAHQFEQYTFQLFSLLLKYRLKPQHKDYEEFKKKLVDEIAMRAHRSIATVKLFGIVLESSEIIISRGVNLRQTRKSDLEISSKLGADHMFAALPSAILEIELQTQANEHGILQQKVGEYIKLIRLFAIGSVSYNSYRMEFNTISAPGAEAGNGYQLINPWRKYYLRKIDEAHFIGFLNKLPLVPEFRLFDKNANHITTAFDRFSEALLERVAIERKIANAVMGIEALLSIENDELKFRMQLRVAKLLSNFGFEPLNIKADIKNAYDIRSKFAHGGYLTKEKRVALDEKVSPAGGFLATIINYLRIIIITELAIDISKPQLVALLDDSLIDNKKEKELRLKLKSAKKFLAKNPTLV